MGSGSYMFCKGLKHHAASGVNDSFPQHTSTKDTGEACKLCLPRRVRQDCHTRHKAVHTTGSGTSI